MNTNSDLITVQSLSADGGMYRQLIKALSDVARLELELYALKKERNNDGDQKAK